jgi:adenylylsulfate kinase-like enzyme
MPHDVFKRQYQRYETKALKGEAQDHPVAIIMAGQPGSRKSTLTTIAEDELKSRGGYVLVDADKAREWHPAYTDLMHENDKEAANKTHTVASMWVKRLTEKGIGERRNLILDQTSKDADKVRQQAMQLREAGYRVEVRAMATSDVISEQGIYRRYEEQKIRNGMGRFTPKETHDKAYQGIPLTVERIEKKRLVDKISIYDFSGKLIYNNELKNGEWQAEPRGREALEAERNRALTPFDRQEFKQNYKGLLAVMMARHASKHELDEVKTLWDSAEKRLDARTAGERAEKQRMIVLNGQRILQENVDGAWENRKVDKAGSLGPGIYNLYAATEANKDIRHEGTIVFTTEEKVYQQVKGRMIVHDKKYFDIIDVKTLDAGKCVGIGYNAKGKASIDLALKLAKGRSR